MLRKRGVDSCELVFVGSEKQAISRRSLEWGIQSGICCSGCRVDTLLEGSIVQGKLGRLRVRLTRP